LRSFEQHLNDFTQRGIEIAAISVDSTEDSRKLSQTKGYTFPVLSDPQAEVIRNYGLLHPKGGENGQDIARPAEILIDSRGTVRWENLTDDLRVRARPGQVLQAFDSTIGKLTATSGK
jgi:peroxiredoxin